MTPEAGSLHRTAMTQPGVYFTLDAPFIRIIGLFSNALEDPGVISSEEGTWKAVPDYQLDFLSAQLGRIRSDGFAGAVLLAVHHPPFTYAPPPSGSGAGGAHGGNPVMLAQIDAICQAMGVYPHAIVSGHAHNYQRFTRSIRFAAGSYEVPFIVCGDGGHGLASLVQSRLGSPAQEPTDGIDVSYLDTSSTVDTRGLTLDRHDDANLRLSSGLREPKSAGVRILPVDAGVPPNSLSDGVSVDLASHTVVAAQPTAARNQPSVRRVARKAAGPNRRASNSVRK